ncbi:MAG: hypothetical protein H6662_02820 [Ardenticatenaceae bacterium]|nr:hypothetical protein [Ardenticatenaceae bacterium]
MHVKAAAGSRFARTRTLLDSQRSTICADNIAAVLPSPGCSDYVVRSNCAGFSRTAKWHSAEPDGSGGAVGHTARMVAWAIGGKELGR